MFVSELVQRLQQLHMSIFAGELTSYTTRHTKISYCLAYQCSQVNLRATPPDTPGSATASQINVRRLTYFLHHQTHQGQLLHRISIFAGQLTRYTTRHTKVSYCLAYQSSQVNLRATPPDTPVSYCFADECSQVNLLPTPPDTPRSATASHINLCRSTYTLHHQTH
jgi:hypothetical protein